MPALKSQMAYGFVQSWQNISPTIHMELADIQKSTARLCTKEVMCSRDRTRITSATMTVGTIMIVPMVFDIKHQLISFTNQKRMCMLSNLLKRSVLMLQYYSIERKRAMFWSNSMATNSQRMKRASKVVTMGRGMWLIFDNWLTVTPSFWESASNSRFSFSV